MSVQEATLFCILGSAELPLGWPTPPPGHTQGAPRATTPSPGHRSPGHPDGRAAPGQGSAG